MAVGKLITVVIGAVILINVAVALLPVAFNSSAITTFTVWGVDYLWILGIFALVVVFGMLLMFWNDIKSKMGL